MAAELPYFRFSPQEWQNGDISMENYELQGFFVNVCCYYWVKNCSTTLALLEKRFSNAKAMLQELVQAGVLKHTADTDEVEIAFLDAQFDILKKSKKLRQKAGKIGGKKRSENFRKKIEFDEDFGEEIPENENGETQEPPDSSGVEGCSNAKAMLKQNSSNAQAMLKQCSSNAQAKRKEKKGKEKNIYIGVKKSSEEGEEEGGDAGTQRATVGVGNQPTQTAKKEKGTPAPKSKRLSRPEKSKLHYNEEYKNATQEQKVLLKKLADIFKENNIQNILKLPEQITAKTLEKYVEKYGWDMIELKTIGMENQPKYLAERKSYPKTLLTWLSNEKGWPSKAIKIQTDDDKAEFSTRKYQS